MVSQTGRFASLVILLFAVTGCALQERKPMYDGWSMLATVPVANSEIAVAELDGKIYVVVGRLEGGFRSERTDVVEVFDPKTNQWSKRRSMLRPRGGVNGIAANGCFHLFGGEGNPDHSYGIYPDHDYYNPVTDS
jgi:hypothetical protein